MLCELALVEVPALQAPGGPDPIYRLDRLLFVDEQNEIALPRLRVDSRDQRTNDEESNNENGDYNYNERIVVLV